MFLIMGTKDDLKASQSTYFRFLDFVDGEMKAGKNKDGGSENNRAAIWIRSGRAMACKGPLQAAYEELTTKCYWTVGIN